jgi:hypothetical protein
MSAEYYICKSYVGPLCVAEAYLPNAEAQLGIV